MKSKSAVLLPLVSFSLAFTSIVLADSAQAVAKADSTGATPSVGEMSPASPLTDLEGHATSLSELTGKSKVVLVVLRGYPGYQCPICSIQVGGLISKAQQFKDAGAQVVLVYPGPSENLTGLATEFMKGKPLPENFHLTTDPDYKFTNSWGLRWDAPRETAYPSTFVIDEQGVIRFTKVSKTHGDRANPTDVLQALSAND